MIQHFFGVLVHWFATMLTVSYEFLINPKESADVTRPSPCGWALGMRVLPEDNRCSLCGAAVYEMQVNSDIVRSQMMVRHSIGTLHAGLIPRPPSVEE